MSRAILTIEHVSKIYKIPIKPRDGALSAFRNFFNRKYKTIPAVNDVSFRVEEGTVHGLIGQNGAGKSTLIKIMSGILYPSSGEVRAFEMIPWKERTRYVRKIGVMFGQKSQLYWDLPPLDTYRLLRVIHKIPCARFEENIRFFSQLLELDHLLGVPVRNLSLGERIRCELVCALLHEPPLLFLDEPTIGLDLFARDSIRDFLNQINRTRGVTIVLTTHDLGEIEALCSHITMIDRGKILFDGTLPHLQGRYSSERYIEFTFRGAAELTGLADVDIVSSGSNTLVVRTSVDQVRSTINRLCENRTLHDIQIRTVDLESIVKSFYIKNREMSE